MNFLRFVDRKIFSYSKIEQIYRQLSNFDSVSPFVTERFVSSLGRLLKKGSSIRDAIDCSVFCIPEKARSHTIERLAALGEGDEFERSLVGVFPLLSPYSGLISQSLSSGELAETLEMIASRLTYERGVRSQMKSALMYPVLLCGIAILAVGAMLLFIVPQVQKSLASSRIQVGVMSKVVFTVSNIMVNYPFACLLSVAIIVFLVMSYHREVWKFIQTQFIFRPVLYKLISDYELSLFWSYISLAYVSSRDMGSSFVEGSKNIKNQAVSAYFGIVGKNISNDLVNSLSAVSVSTKLNKYIHKDIVDYWCAMVVVQLRSGSLDLVFAELADFHKERNEQKIKLISKLSEPVAMIIIGGVIGLISLAMLSPFYEMTQGITNL